MSVMLIQTLPFMSKEGALQIADTVLQIESLWEYRKDRVPTYRQGKWATIGCPMYLDSQPFLIEPNAMGEKVRYFNDVLWDHFEQLYFALKKTKNFLFLGAHVKGVKFLCEKGLPISMPGMHIFPPHATGKYFFANKHQDLQWKAFEWAPQWKEHFDVPVGSLEHFSLTLPLMLPRMGGSLLYGHNLEHRFEYQEGVLVKHSGQFNHAIAPNKAPVMPGDYRITLQAHGFIHESTAYLYW